MYETNDEKRFISMLSDYGFKTTFGNENHPLFLRRALQALIDSDTPIREVTFTKNEVNAVTKHARGGLFDIICEDELGRVFIVEMQLLNVKYMIHRAKFYAFHRYNVMIRKGNYRFNDLKPIYTVSILANNAYATDLYHQIGTIKNQRGELMDNQITHVVVELNKFQKPLEQVKTDLDKLLYTMKLTDNAPPNVQLPRFMQEGWLEEALKELERADMTPEQRAYMEMEIAATMTEQVAMEEKEERVKKETEERVKKETEEGVKKETEERVKKETEERVKKETQEQAVANMIQKGYRDQEVAEIMNVSMGAIEAVKKKLNPR